MTLNERIEEAVKAFGEAVNHDNLTFEELLEEVRGQLQAVARAALAQMHATCVEAAAKVDLSDIGSEHFFALTQARARYMLAISDARVKNGQ